MSGGPAWYRMSRPRATERRRLKEWIVYLSGHVRVCLAPPREGGVGQRRHGLGSPGVGLVPMVSEQERVWKVSQFSVLVSL